MKYVIIGGDAAGMSAAMQIFKYDQDASITTLEKGAIYSYAQCGMPYVISGVIPSSDELVMRSAETFQDKFNIDARVFHEVDGVDTKQKIVTGFETQTGETFTIPYDKLLIATGADPVIPNWPGTDLRGVHTLKTIPDTEAIKAHVHNHIKDITIIGGGYIGLEMAESFHQLGKHVRLINRSEQVAKIFDIEMAHHIHDELKKHQIELLLDEDTIAIEGDEQVQAVRTEMGVYETDLVLIATGVQPNTKFLQHTAIKTAENGAVSVNERLETNVEDVYAAGDCAQQYHIVKQGNDFIPLGTHANKQGRIAGMNMTGKTRHFKGVVGTSILRMIDLTLARTGLSEREAKKASIPYSSVMIEATDIAGYYPGASTLTVKLIYRSDNRLLLGGQVIGKEGADKRIDVLATALFNQMTVGDLEDLDLSYAPPYNGVWDPVQRAARKAISQLEK